MYISYIRIYILYIYIVYIQYIWYIHTLYYYNQIHRYKHVQTAHPAVVRAWPKVKDPRLVRVRPQIAQNLQWSVVQWSAWEGSNIREAKKINGRKSTLYYVILTKLSFVGRQEYWSNLPASLSSFLQTFQFWWSILGTSGSQTRTQQARMDEPLSCPKNNHQQQYNHHQQKNNNNNNNHHQLVSWLQRIIQD